MKRAFIVRSRLISSQSCQTEILSLVGGTGCVLSHLRFLCIQLKHPVLGCGPPSSHAAPTRSQRVCRKLVHLPRSVIGCWVHMQGSSPCQFWPLDVASLLREGLVNFGSGSSLCQRRGRSCVCGRFCMILWCALLRTACRGCLRRLNLRAGPAQFLVCCHRHLRRHLPELRGHFERPRTALSDLFCGGFRRVQVALKMFAVALDQRSVVFSANICGVSTKLIEVVRFCRLSQRQGWQSNVCPSKLRNRVFQCIMVCYWVEVTRH